MCCVLVQSILKVVLFQCEVGTSFRERKKKDGKKDMRGKKMKVLVKRERNTITENITNER